MLQEQISYSNTGKESCLRAILKGTRATSSHGYVPQDVATKVVARLNDVLRSTFLNDKRFLVWCVLHNLCGSDDTSTAANFLRKLDNSPVLKYVQDACENYPKSECCASLNFLFQFATSGYERPSLILKKSGLLDVMLRILEFSISAHDGQTANVILRIFGAILDPCSPLDKFLELDGFHKLLGAFDTIVTRGLQNYHETGAGHNDSVSAIGEIAFTLAQYMWAAFVETEAVVNSAVAPSLYFLTAGEVRQFTLQLNNAYDILPDCEARHRVVYTVLIAHSYVSYFTAYGNEITSVNLKKRSWLIHLEAPQQLLLSPGPMSGTSLLSKCLRELRTKDEIDGAPTTDAVGMFDNICARSSLVTAAMEEEIGEQLVYCGLPTCCITNLKRGRLKKCSRCMSVWYCCKEHQVAHWKEHKPDCKRVQPGRTPAATATAEVKCGNDVDA